MIPVTYLTDPFRSAPVPGRSNMKQGRSAPVPGQSNVKQGRSAPVPGRSKPQTASGSVIRPRPQADKPRNAVRHRVESWAFRRMHVAATGDGRTPQLHTDLHSGLVRLRTLPFLLWQ